MDISIQSSMMVGLAFAVSAGLVPVLRGPAVRCGLVDNPCRRKQHEGLIPLTGGLAMFIAFLTAMLIDTGQVMTYASLLFGMTVLLLVGILDDFVDLRAMVKLAIQIAVATLVVTVGGLELVHLGEVFGSSYGKVGLGPFSTPFTIICIVFVVNVMNMADGVDGLAGGIGVICLGLLALVGALNGASASLTTMCLVLAMATAGFLLWNIRFPFRERAAAFMGDAGSMMLGFAIAWLAIAMATTPGTTVYPVTIAWILLIPCMDTFALTVRRLSLGRSPMAPDRAHLHHIFQRCHFSVTATVCIIHGLVLCSGLFGILAWKMGWPQPVLFVLAAGGMIGYTGLLLVAHRVIRWRTRRLRYAAPVLKPLSSVEDR